MLMEQYADMKYDTSKSVGAKASSCRPNGKSSFQSTHHNGNQSALEMGVHAPPVFLPGYSGVNAVQGFSALGSSAGYSLLGTHVAVAPFPAWALDVSHVPKIYHNYLKSVVPPGSPTGYPETAAVYKLLLGSGLSREFLGYIWSLANRTLPGQLTPPEFFVVLALVALAQQCPGVPPTIEVLHKADILHLLPKFHLHAADEMMPSVMPSSVATTQPLHSASAPLTHQFAAAQMPTSQFPQRNDSSLTTSSSVCCTSSASTSSSVIATSTTLESAPAGSDKYDVFREVFKEAVVTESPSVQNNEPAAVIDEFQDFQSVASPSHSILHNHNTATKTNSNGAAATFALTSHGKSTSTAPSAFPIIDPEVLIKQQLTHLSLDFKAPTPPLVFQQQTPNASLTHSPSSGSLHSLSHEPSIQSLELKTSANNESGLVSQIFAENSAIPSSKHVLVPDTSVPFDKYAAMRNIQNDDEAAASSAPVETVDRHVIVWTKVIEASCDLLQRAVEMLSEASSSSVCREFTATEKGAAYITSIGEVYRVLCRIKLSLKMTAFQTEHIVSLLSRAKMLWEDFTALLGNCSFLPSDSALDFRGAIINFEAHPELTGRACGICLLNVDCNSREKRLASDGWHFQYGGTAYHAQCGNLYINLIDSVLPALGAPTLL